MDSPPSRDHSAASTSTLPPSYDQAVFSTSSLISLATTTTTLPTPSFQDSFKNFSFLHFPVHPVLDSPSTSLSSPPSYSDSLSSLSTHASMDRPSFSSSHTLTSSLPSSLPPPYPIYRPLPIYASLRGTSSSMESIPHLYSSVLSTNTLSMFHHGGPSTMVSSVPSRPISSGSKKKVTRSWPRNWLRSWLRDNTYYTTRRPSPRPAVPCSSLSRNTVLFPLLSSWANPSIYPFSNDPMNLTLRPRTSLQVSGGFPFQSFVRIRFHLSPHLFPNGYL